MRAFRRFAAPGIGHLRVAGGIADALHCTERGVKTAARARLREFERAVENTETIPSLRKRTQSFVGVDNFAVRAQQNDAIGQQLECVFQYSGVIAVASQVRRNIVSASVMRVETSQQRDLAFVHMALLAGPLHSNNDQFVGRLFEHDRYEITQPKAGQEFSIKWVARHLRFIEELTIPSYITGALAKRVRNTRVKRGKMFDILRTADCGQTGRPKLDRPPGRFADDFKSRAKAAKQRAGRLQRLRHARAIEAARINSFDRL
ncbi:MAG TPA: hypothetical protein VKD19_04955 [Pseudolabrys sp.]|nr:hypothetical protein [Pseudolabrys sp.]